MTKYEAAANMAFFLLEKTGSVLGTWTGRLTAKEQRAMFGVFIGKGKLLIDGTAETIEHSVKVCFGLDSDVTFSARWDDVAGNAARMAAFAASGYSNVALLDK